MGIALLGIIGVLFGGASPAHADSACSFSSNPLLGWWSVSHATAERSNHTTWSCGEVLLHLACGKNNELDVEWGYSCGRWTDWNYGGKKSIPVQGENLLGQDGYLKNGEFYWDSLIPKVGGSKITLKASGAEASLEIGEDPKYYYPELTFRGQAKKVTKPTFELSPANFFPETRLHGAWTGKIRIISAGEPEIECAVPKWELNYQHHFLFQTSLYLPNCQEQVNFWLGPNYVRGEKLFAYKTDSEELEQVGSVSAQGWTRTYKYYVVKREELTLVGDDELIYRLFTADKEYRLELHRP